MVTFSMKQTAGETEIQLIRKWLPDADILGVVRDGKGLLIEMKHIKGIHASHVQHCEQKLIAAGVTHWTWNTNNGQMQIRAYWDKPSNFLRHSGAALAILLLAAYWFYDVHTAKTISSWLAALQ